MHSTKCLSMGRGMVSTVNGQRRILRRPMNLLTYIQRAVKAGTYRTSEEVQKLNEKIKGLLEQDDGVIEDRLRENLLRGSKIQNYPDEYKILSLNPPMPFKPSMPKKYLRKQAQNYIQNKRPTDRLAIQYLSRHSHQQQASSGRTNSIPNQSSDDYYRKLLGVEHVPRVDSAMGNKSALLNKAYAVAVKQYQLMRTEDLSEADALDKVEELLKQEDSEERHQSRAKLDLLQKRREEWNKKQEQQDAASTQKKKTKRQRKQERYDTAKHLFNATNTTKLRQDLEAKSKQEKEPFNDSSYLSLLHSNDHRAYEGMISWTNRLQAVPYAKWTVGASVSLDHWIAKRVLGLSEETWLALLEGDDPQLLSRGRDIVAARHALFPETIFDGEIDDKDDDYDEGDLDALDDKKESGEAGIDEMLATLGKWSKLKNEGGGGDSKSKQPKDWDWKLNQQEQSEEKVIIRLTDELQEWRARQVQTPYEQWSSEKQQELNAWIEGYVAALTPGELANGKVDLEATRIALLASPPHSKQESSAFWDSIRDETAAEVLLNKILKAGPPENATDVQRLFWELPYQEQLDRLVALGTIREIADEYSTDLDRTNFLDRYGDYLLEGVVFDHLVSDPNGPITGADLGDRLVNEWKISKDERFRIERIPYGSEEAVFGETDSAEVTQTAAKRAREMFRAWNKLKAGRAHYEERLFKQGLLGLRYGDEEQDGLAKKK